MSEAGVAGDVEQVDLPLDVLVVDPLNPRGAVSVDEEMIGSVVDRGVTAPLIVRPLEDGAYGVLAGSRRLGAARQAGQETLPCRVHRDLDDVDAAAIALADNVVRQDLNPVDEAEAYEELVEVRGLSQAEVARRVGVPVSRVRQRLRLLTLPEQVCERLRRGETTIASAERVLRRRAQADGASRARPRRAGLQAVESPPPESPRARRVDFVALPVAALKTARAVAADLQVPVEAWVTTVIRDAASSHLRQRGIDMPPTRGQDTA